MTRETKIGLLVGLGFIILFGLILGERSGMHEDLDGELASVPVNPGLGAFAGRGSIEPVLRTHERLSEPPAPLTGRAAASVAVPPPPPPRPVSEGGAFFPDRVQREPEATPAWAPSAPSVPTWRPPTEPAPAVAPAPTPAPTMPVRGHWHVVEAGESLYRIASRYYGPDGTRHYRRIFEANREQLPSESAVVVGQRLFVPALEGASPAAPAVAPSASVARTPAASAERSYTVQRGDTLWRIARTVLHDDSPQAVQRLFDANRDRLRTPDDLKVGQELRIPG